MIWRRILIAAAVASLLAGCVSSMLARQIVAPPNRSGIEALFARSEIVRQAPRAFHEVWTVRAGPPDANIVVASIEPGDYGFEYDLRLEYRDGRVAGIEKLVAHWRDAPRTPAGASAVELARPVAPRGTLLFLHGYLQDKRFLTPWAIRLAQQGYRCAVLDLRGHGDSTGRHISFGAHESADVSAVIDDLGRRGWDVSRVGLFGVSYGASVALIAAGRDARVRGVVAIEPFASAEKAVPELMRAVFAQQARGISDRQFAAAHLKEAAIAGFRWEDADIPAALARTTAPVLFLHGEADTWLSPEHSRALATQAPAGSVLRLVPREDHVSLPLQIQQFAPEVIGWFDATVMKR